MMSRFFALGLLAAAVFATPLTKSVSDAKEAYGFVYFTGETLADGEQIYFAVSEGNSPASWTTVNAGRPVLNSTLGEKGVRDPYIIRDPENNKFFIIATDLKMYGSGRSWDTAGRYGSLSLSVWESDNLKDWSPQRLVEVSPPTAGMSWAPEVTYVDGTFIVYWASHIFESTDTNHTATPSGPFIMYSNTTDFVTFTEAQKWIDASPNTLIDTSVAWDEANQLYHRFSAINSFVWQESSPSFFGEWTTVKEKIGTDTPRGVEGPAIFEDNLEKGKWHLFLDGLSPKNYLPYETTDLASGNWTRSVGYNLPTNPRHGTVFSITAAEKAALRSISV